MASMSLLSLVWLILAPVRPVPSAATPDGHSPDIALPAGGAPNAMRLPDAIAYALAHQPSLQAALARVAAVAAEARVPRAQWLPSLTAVGEGIAGTTNNSTASYLSVPGAVFPRIGATPTDTHSWSPSSSTLAGIGVEQEVYDFGRISAQAAAADAALSLERARATSERLGLELVVKDAYYGVLGAKEVLRAAQDAFARARVHRNMAAAAVKSGLHAPIELTRAEADLTRFQVSTLRAAGALQQAQLVFAAAVGVTEPALDATAPVAANPPAPLPEVMRDLVLHSPLLVEAEASVRLQAARTHALDAGARPNLVLSGTLSARAGSAAASNGQADGWLPDVPNWNLGLVLRWPLSDPVLAAQVRASAAREQVARADQAAALQQVTAGLRSAYVAYDVAQASLVSLQHADEAARANYSQAEARFGAGLGTAVELADAEAIRVDAEIQLAVGRFAVSRARAVIARLAGEDS